MRKSGELIKAASQHRKHDQPRLRVAARDGLLVADIQSSITPSKGRSANTRKSSLAAERISLGSEVARLVEDARKADCTELATGLEDCFMAFLRGLPKAEKRAVLLLAYDTALLRGEKQTAPTAVLVRPVGT
jgi:hypothetical protein